MSRCCAGPGWSASWRGRFGQAGLCPQRRWATGQASSPVVHFGVMGICPFRRLRDALSRRRLGGSAAPDGARSTDAAGSSRHAVMYYLRIEKDYQCLVYCPRLALELGSCVDGEAHGWAWKPYGWFDPAPRPGDIAHTHFYRRRPCLRLSGAHHERLKARCDYAMRPCHHLHLLHG